MVQAIQQGVLQEDIAHAIELASFEAAMKKMMRNLNEGLNNDNGLQLILPALKELVTKVITINKALQESFQEQSKKVLEEKNEEKQIEKTRRSWWLNSKVVKIVKWTNYAVGALSIAASATGIYYSQDDNCQNTTIPLSLNLATVIASGIFGVALQKITDKEDKLKEQIQNKHDKEIENKLIDHSKKMEAKMLHAFFVALEGFEKSKEEKSLKRCLKKFNRLKVYKDDLPEKDRLISSLIKALPSENPLKSVVEELYALAINESAPADEPLLMNERQTVSSLAKPALERKHNISKSAGSDRDFGEMSPSLLSQNSSSEISPRAQRYIRRWVELEKYLGCPINFLEMGGIRLPRDLVQSDLNKGDVVIQIEEESEIKEKERSLLRETVSHAQSMLGTVIIHIPPEK